MSPLLLIQQAEALLRRGLPARALPRLDRALRSRPDRFLRADLLGRRAEALKDLGRFGPALRDYWAAHALYRTLGVRAERLRTLLGASACLRVLSRYRWADAMWRSVRTLLPPAAAPRTDPPFEEFQMELALVRRGLGDMAGAARLLRKVIPRLAARKDVRGLQHAWWALAGAERFSGRFRLALGGFERAESLARGTGDRSAAAYALCGQAACHRILGRGETSFQKYRDAWETFSALKDPFGRAYGFCGMGNALRVWGDARETLGLYEKSAALYRTVGDRGSEAFAYWGLGGSLRRLRDLRRAERFYHRALGLFKTVGDHRGVIMTLLGLARVARAGGGTAKALRLAAQALRLSRRERLPYEAALSRWEAGADRGASGLRVLGIPAFAVRGWRDLP